MIMDTVEVARRVDLDEYSQDSEALVHLHRRWHEYLVHFLQDFLTLVVDEDMTTDITNQYTFQKEN